jgi:hypothetical protein
MKLAKRETPALVQAGGTVRPCTRCRTREPVPGRVQCAECRALHRRTAHRKRPGTRLVDDWSKRGLMWSEARIEEIRTKLDGISKQRVAQLASSAIDRLRSPQHRERVTKRLRDALREMRLRRDMGEPLERVYEAALVVEDLTMALDWLDAYANGEFRERLADRDNEQTWERTALLCA